ncbi:GNAT family N-acetyltransferase [Plantactinospora soyae]|uniref:GNAT superfamily N-acetyltransferase n=1 Tax=Plantactinospora soyae TaxID=1544732 RepID=A0A927R7R2_9ACTN|nr:GNAT family N-acetyltransferase [Plantactinospora soyae]MBE1488101.1 GNAT superfamily N-acetyltransferase [Plantactinospora soyae]
MGEVRRATPTDTAELVRLRGVLLSAIAGGEPIGDEWRRTTTETLRSRLSETDPTLVAFVVELSERPGVLAACAVGTVEYRLGGPSNPGGEVGYVFNVATDPDHRRRGYSRRCMTALLDWYRDRGIRTVDLRASEAAEPLYRSLGFVRTPDPAMRLRLSTVDA